MTKQVVTLTLALTLFLGCGATPSASAPEQEQRSQVQNVVKQDNVVQPSNQVQNVPQNSNVSLTQGMEAYQRKDYVSALKLLTKSCDENAVDGCYKIATMYYSGQRVKIDLKKAAGFYAKACKANHPSACSALGHMYSDGKGVGVNLIHAKSLYDYSCNLGDKNGCVSAKELPAMITGVFHTKDFSYNSPDNLEEAGGILDKAQKGDKEAQFNIGNNYTADPSMGHFGLNKNYEEAVKWYRLSAQQGYPAAIGALGVHYLHGCGVQQDYKKALELLLKSVKNTECQEFSLIPNKNVSPGLIKELKKLGYTDSSVTTNDALSDIYKQGLGVKKDLKKSKKWGNIDCYID